MPVDGGDNLQQVHVDKGAGEVQRVRQFVTKIYKFKDLCKQR